MQGTIIHASYEDSLCITRADGRRVQIPAACVLAIDAILRHCLTADVGLEVEPVGEIDEGEEVGWEAFTWDGPTSQFVDTPWQAVLDLARRLEE